MSEDKPSKNYSLVILFLVCVAVVIVGVIASSRFGLASGAFVAGVALIVSAIGVIGYLKIFPRTQTLQQPKIPQFREIHPEAKQEIEAPQETVKPPYVVTQISELTIKIEALSKQIQQVAEANVKPVPLEEQITQRQKEIELEKENNELKRQQVIASSLTQIKNGIENQTQGFKAKLKEDMLTKEEPMKSKSIIVLEPSTEKQATLPIVNQSSTVEDEKKQEPKEKEKQTPKTEEEPVEEKLFQ